MPISRRPTNWKAYGRAWAKLMMPPDVSPGSEATWVPALEDDLMTSSEQK